MLSFEKPKQVIIGSPEYAEVEFSTALPAREVKNILVWENRDVEMPFRLKRGQPTPIGVFLTPRVKKSETPFRVKVTDNHFRSALLGHVIFQDKEGRMYRDVDIKGMGPISERLEVRRLERQSAKRLPRGKTPWGFCDWGYAEIDRKISEFFLKRGLRTHRVLAIIRLQEVIDNSGKKISIPEARRQGYIKTTTEPVIEVRAFGTKARIADINLATWEDARKMVAQELGESDTDFSREKYFLWFAKTLGKQVAILHRNGYWHGYLTTHNITLDCRVVDLDSVEKLPPNEKARLTALRTDLQYATDSLQSLKNALLKFLRTADPVMYDSLSTSTFYSGFFTSYFANAGPEIQRKKALLEN